MHAAKGFVLVLVEPQDAANVGAVVRVMKNYNLQQLRLVSPAAGVWNPARIETLAHRSADIVAACRIFDTLADALADLNTVVGTTARPRATPGSTLAPAAAAGELQARAALGPVGILFGPETNGLTNAMLDSCHLLISIPTDPTYRSLNLAQAALIVCYELWLAQPNRVLPAALPEREPAPGGLLEALFADATETLRAIGFSKPGREIAIIRRVRALVHRAQPDRQEIALLHAISREVRKAVRRNETD